MDYPAFDREIVFRNLELKLVTDDIERRHAEPCSAIGKINDACRNSLAGRLHEGGDLEHRPAAETAAFSGIIEWHFVVPVVSIKSPVELA